MPQEQLAASYFSPDILDFIKALHRHEVRYLIVGGEAVIYYGHARYTGDVDFFYEGSEANAKAMFAALTDFWGGHVPDMTDYAELTEPGLILQFGSPPNRIDLLNQIDGVLFEDAWPTRAKVKLDAETEEISLPYLGLEKLIQNKEASGRGKDLEDLKYLTARAAKDRNSSDEGSR